MLRGIWKEVRKSGLPKVRNAFKSEFEKRNQRTDKSVTKRGAEAFEERKNMAKKLGEEAGTKLMIPLFLMLAVVFVIVTVPAFLTIQI